MIGRRRPVKDVPVRDIMADHLEVIRLGAKLSDARRQFFSGLFHHLPVVGPDGVLVGLLSSTDLLRMSVDAYGVDGKGTDAELDARFTLADVMSTDVITLGPDDLLSRAAELLSEGEFHALPVVDKRQPVGIVTSTDLIVFLRRQLR